MKEFTIAVLPGDGIGPEVTGEAVRVLAAVADLYGYRIRIAGVRHRRGRRGRGG